MERNCSSQFSRMRNRNSGWDAARARSTAFGTIQTMTPMASYSKNEVVLVQYPYTDLTGAKVRPAVVVGAPSASQDILIVPLTSQVSLLQGTEFVLVDWQDAGLNRPTAVKRGVFTVHERLVTMRIGKLSVADDRLTSLTLRVGVRAVCPPNSRADE